LVVVVALVLSSVGAAGDKAPDPNSPEFPVYVMNKIDDQYRGAQSHGVMSMTVKTKRYERTMSLESWSLGKDYSLVRILTPKKERGTSTLKAGKTLYTYLSKTDRTIKITSAMMGGSWMGSHFTNDDLVHDSRLADDFTIQRVKSPEDQYRFELIAKPKAAVVWGKIEVTVRKSDLQPLSQLFFDEKGRKVRMLEFSDHKTIGDRTMPTRMVMKPLDGSGEYTEVRWDNIDFGVKLKKSFFSIQNLKSM
jgi:outer membrane lipoprotein-sorting protein